MLGAGNGAGPEPRGRGPADYPAPRTPATPPPSSPPALPRPRQQAQLPGQEARPPPRLGLGGAPGEEPVLAAGAIDLPGGAEACLAQRPPGPAQAVAGLIDPGVAGAHTDVVVGDETPGCTGRPGGQQAAPLSRG